MKMYKDNLQIIKNGEFYILYRISNNTYCPIYKDKDINKVKYLI